MTRTWEIADAKAMPLDMVREQDFTLRVRRMQKLETPYLVVNLALSAIEGLAGNKEAFDALSEKIKSLAASTRAETSDMSNGDLFLVWKENADARGLAQNLIAVLPTQAATASERFLLIYHMPKDYVALRERCNHYVEVVRAATVAAAGSPAEKLKKGSGQLTASMLDQIGKLLDDIDLRPYTRHQPIYRTNGTSWQMVSEEHFISFDDLRRERFPKLDLITPEHLFFALCERVDQKFLHVLTTHGDVIAGKSVHLNLSVASVISDAFAHFGHSIPKARRNLITFELHRGDLFQDFNRTLDAMAALKSEGFRIAFDSITPDMLPYTNLAAFDVDEIKINVSRERVNLLTTTPVQRALMQIPAQKLVFFRCDSDKALLAGREIGVELFQGWHIDDLANKKP